jgi:deoxyribodipyrimidine photolyase-related protein
MMQSWRDRLGLPVDIRADDRFLCSRDDFSHWLSGRAAPRMEFFYREMRRRTGWLMESDGPVGGQWNFDSENRKKLPAREVVPPRSEFVPDAVTREVIALVAAHFAGHVGELDRFRWAVTREEALQALRNFLRESLPRFGDYQDAMRAGSPWLFHSVISPYLNIGLLGAREVCEAAIAEWRAGRAPLNAVEGFLRQILGWREYVRGLYWARMPGYATGNFLEARRPLPGFYWTADTSMRCLHETVADTLRHAYAHHIQRLMVTGNFALLAGIRPEEVEAWYLLVYADAFEWVELPNVHGMVLHADGGLLGSKPYAASGAYIDRMSDYCKGCAYDVKQKSGASACPFNYLYWDFLMRNESKLGSNARLAMPYRSLAAMDQARKAQIRSDAARFLDSLAEERS